MKYIVCITSLLYAHATITNQDASPSSNPYGSVTIKCVQRANHKASQPPQLTISTYPHGVTITPQSSSYWQLPDRHDLISTVKKTITSLNPYTIAAATTVLVYGGFLAKLLFSAYSVTQPNKWSNWKEHIPLEVLTEVPQHEVAEELVDAIKAKYLTTQSLDLMTPLVQFNNAVDKELSQLNKFLQIHEWLDYTKLAYIFPRQHSHVMMARAKIKRLLYLKDVLLSWMSNYSKEIVHDQYVPRTQTNAEITEPVVVPLPTESECAQ